LQKLLYLTACGICWYFWRGCFPIFEILMGVSYRQSLLYRGLHCKIKVIQTFIMPLAWLVMQMWNCSSKIASKQKWTCENGCNSAQSVRRMLCSSMHLVWDSVVLWQLLLLFFVMFLMLVYFIPANIIGNLNFLSFFVFWDWDPQWKHSACVK
jgi:hypothetical protein